MTDPIIPEREIDAAAEAYFLQDGNTGWEITLSSTRRLYKGRAEAVLIAAARARGLDAATIERCAAVIEAWPTWDVWRGEGADAIRALKETR